MSPSKEVIYGLTIFLTVGAILLIFAVIGIYLFYRRLRKKIEETINSDNDIAIEMDDQKAENETRKKNKYIKSFKQDKGEKDEDNYDMPDIDTPDLLNPEGSGGSAHDLRGVSAGRWGTDGIANAATAANKTAVSETRPGATKHHFYRDELNQQNASAHTPRGVAAGHLNQSFQSDSNISGPSYLEMINDGDTVDEAYYTQATEKPITIASKHAPKPQPPPRQHPRQLAPRSVTQHHSADDVNYDDEVIETYYTDPIPEKSNIGASHLAAKPQLPSKLHPWQCKSRPVTKQHPSRNYIPRPMKDRNHNAMQQEMSRYHQTDNEGTSRTLPMNQRRQQPQDTRSMGRHYNNELHPRMSHNQKVSHATPYYNTRHQGLDQQMRATADMRRTDHQQEEEYYLSMASNNHGYQEEEFYGNQDVIDRCQGYEEEERFENQEIVDEFNRLKSYQRASNKGHVTESFHQNAYSQETSQGFQVDTIYENYERDHVTTEDHIYTNEKDDNELPIYGNVVEAEEEHFYGNEKMLSSC